MTQRANRAAARAEAIIRSRKIEPSAQRVKVSVTPHAGQVGEACSDGLGEPTDRDGGRHTRLFDVFCQPPLRSLRRHAVCLFIATRQ